MLRAAAARDPEHRAVVFGAEVLSYGALLERVDGFAGWLAGQGAAPGDVVWVVLGNRPEFVVAYYATAVLGAVVHAVDPSLTDDEIAGRLTLSPPAFLVTDQAWAVRAPRLLAGAEGCQLLLIDGASPSTDGARAAARVPAEVDQPWVHAYSSGSMGEPTLVSRSQRNQVSEAGNIVASAAITPTDLIVCAVPLFHALGQYCCMLVSARAGATLLLLDSSPAEPGVPQAPVDPAALVELAQRERATIFIAVPYIYEAMADVARVDPPEDLDSVRLWLSGSNFLSASTLQRFYDRYGATIRQTYGSTEAGSVSWDCAADVARGSVGHPLHGVRVRIVDEQGRPVAPGSAGEIVVSSDSVAVGDGSGYATGDLGRLAEDGRLYLLGRKRLLVDVGGRKVNVVEIEDVLREHPGVADAAVGVDQDAGPAAALVAYVVAPPDLDAPALDRYCRAALSAYKVPNEFRFVASIPRTALGKPRRGMLGTLPSELRGGQGRRAIATDEQEGGELTPDLLRDCVAAALGIDEQLLAGDADLHELGFDSLGALRLRMRLQHDFGAEISLAGLLRAQRLSDVSALVASSTAAAPLLGRADPAATTFALSPNQAAIWFADQIDPAAAAYNCYVAGRIVSDWDEATLCAAFTAAVNRHPILRTVYPVVDGEPRQRVLEEARFDFATLDARGGPDLLDRLLDGEVSRPFDLEVELPLRVRVVLTDDAPVLLIVTHHIAADYWSINILLRDLGAAYQSLATGTQLVHAGSGHDYLAYCDWLAGLIEGETGQSDRAYWSRVLATVPPALDLSRRPRRAKSLSAEGHAFFRELPPELVAEVRRFAGASGNTSYAVLLAAFTVLLHTYSGEADIAVAAMGSTRRRQEFYDVVGHFVNPFVCRTELSPASSFGAVLQGVRESLIDGVEHGLLPFATVVSDIMPRHDRVRAPAANFAFGQDLPHDRRSADVTSFVSGLSQLPLSLGPLVLEPCRIDRRSVVFDLSGAVYESGDQTGIAWEYSSQLVTRAEAQRMAERYERLLAECLAAPDSPIGSLTALSAAERRTAAELAQPEAPTLDRWADQVSARAAAAPDAVAVRTDAVELSYAVLVGRARSLADEVLAGAAPGVAVSISAGPLGVAVAALAAAFTGRPWQLRGAPARGALEVLLRPGGAPATRCLPITLDETGGSWTSGPPRAGGGDQGTVEQPGVVDARIGRSAALLATVAPEARDVLIAAAGDPADALRLLAALATGATVTLADRGRNWLAAAGPNGARYDVVFATATDLAAALATGTPEPAADGSDLPAVAVVRGLVPDGLAPAWLERGGVGLVAEYSSSATGALLAVRNLTEPGGQQPGGQHSAVQHPDGPWLVGAPVPGVALQVLSAAGRPCGVGVSGRLVAVECVQWPVGTAGGAWSQVTTDTGDWGELRSDGAVTFVGSAGRSVRVGRNRFQLEEVEALIQQHESVAACLAEPGGAGVRARVLGRPGTGLTANALRTWVQSRLPGYLVPAEFAILTGEQWYDGVPAAGPADADLTGVR